MSIRQLSVFLENKPGKLSELTALLAQNNVDLRALSLAETNDFGISSRDLAREIPGAVYCATLDQVTDTLEAIVRPGDLVLTVGAGDIYRAGERLLERQ